MPFSSAVTLLASELYSTHGGVQAYTRYLAEILTAYAGCRGGALDCVSLLDDAAVQAQHREPVAYRAFHGSRGSKARFVRQAFQAARRSRPGQMVVAHPGVAPAAWMLRKAGIARSYLVVLHGIEAWCRMDWTDRVAIREAAAIVATTQFTATEFCRYNDVPPERMRIIPLAVPGSTVEGAESDTAGGRKALQVLTVTRMALADRYKGVDTLIDAVGKMRDMEIPVRLQIVGTGDEMPVLKKRSEDLKLNGAVTFRGAVADEELPSLYRGCDVFALPSKGEGFGIVFLEAMRYGKPCIGGNHGGTPEVISHGETGYLVEHGDVNGLVRRLKDLADGELRLDMGRKSARAVQSKYLFTHMQTAWFSLLDEFAQTQL